MIQVVSLENGDHLISKASERDTAFILSILPATEFLPPTGSFLLQLAPEDTEFLVNNYQLRMIILFKRKGNPLFEKQSMGVISCKTKGLSI